MTTKIIEEHIKSKEQLVGASIHFCSTNFQSLEYHSVLSIYLLLRRILKELGVLSELSLIYDSCFSVVSFSEIPEECFDSVCIKITELIESENILIKTYTITKTYNDYSN